MNEKRPTISLILLTYNRANLIERAVDSVLNQTFQDFEILLVNNGSTDNTADVLKKYENNEKVRLFHIKDNVGYKGGMNFALDRIRGEWFTQIGDDDYIVENAFETLLDVPKTIDPEITGITCNSLDAATGEMVGKGLYKDQYLSPEVMLCNTEGIFFGIVKTEFLKGIRHNEGMLGFEHIFWYSIDLNGVKRYYIHKPLRVYNTRDAGRETFRLQSHKGLITKVNAYKELVNESKYFEVMSEYNKKRYIVECIRGMYYMKLGNNKAQFHQYREMLEKKFPSFKYKLMSRVLLVVNSKIFSGLHMVKGFFNIKGLRSFYSIR